MGNLSQIAQPEGLQSEHFAGIDGESPFKTVVVKYEEIEIIIIRRFDRNHKFTLNVLIDNRLQADLFQSFVDGLPAAGQAFPSGALPFFPVLFYRLIQGHKWSGPAV